MHLTWNFSPHCACNTARTRLDYWRSAPCTPFRRGICTLARRRYPGAYCGIGRLLISLHWTPIACAMNSLFGVSGRQAVVESGPCGVFASHEVIIFFSSASKCIFPRLSISRRAALFSRVSAALSLGVAWSFAPAAPQPS